MASKGSRSNIGKVKVADVLTYKIIATYSARLSSRG